MHRGQPEEKGIKKEYYGDTGRERKNLEQSKEVGIEQDGATTIHMNKQCSIAGVIYLLTLTFADIREGNI